MKQALQLRIGQQLTMTPQMQQAIRLLQMSAVELKAEIQTALESNVMLEAIEDDDAPEDAEDPPVDVDEPEWDAPEAALDWSSEPSSGNGTGDAATWQAAEPQ